jgi:hypothetical protein
VTVLAPGEYPPGRHGSGKGIVVGVWYHSTMLVADKHLDPTVFLPWSTIFVFKRSCWSCLRDSTLSDIYFLLLLIQFIVVHGDENANVRNNQHNTEVHPRTSPSQLISSSLRLPAPSLRRTKGIGSRSSSGLSSGISSWLSLAFLSRYVF